MGQSLCSANVENIVELRKSEKMKGKKCVSFFPQSGLLYLFYC